MASMEITTRIGCRNTCVYCPHDTIAKAYTQKSKKYLMSVDLFKACLNKIPLEVKISFSGMCEPWLNSECTRMLLYACGRGHAVEVFTTLVGVSLADIDLIASLKLERFEVHLSSGKEYENILVDHNYLAVLDRLLKSSINATYVFYGKALHPEVNLLIKESGVNAMHNLAHTRANNVELDGKLMTIRKRGVIGCKRNLTSNVLLPNGEVVLCCMDYGMQHVLGNLTTSSYESLFANEVFLSIQRGLKDEAIGTLCRYCEWYAYDVSWYAKVYNRYLYKIERVFQRKNVPKV
jgi:hypothetical protein